MLKWRFWAIWTWTVLVCLSWGIFTIYRQADEVVLAVPALMASTLGALIMTKARGNHIGLILLVGGSAWLVYVSGREYALVSMRSGPLPGEYLAAWLGAWVGPLFFLLFPALLVLFPDGRARGIRRWLMAGLVSVVILTVAGATNLWGVPGEVLTSDRLSDIEPRYTLTNLAFVLSLWSVLPAITSVVLRFREGSQVERQQIKWLLIGAISLGIALSLRPLALEDSDGWGLLIAVGMALFPIAVAIAVFRYRLYDIDRIVSRGISYALVVGLLGLVFATGVIWIPSALTLDDSPLLVAGSTLAVAALFNPLRRRVQAIVDRRFNRSHYDAEQVMERFAGSLRHGIDSDGLMSGLMDVVSETMKPISAAVWVRRDT